MEKTPLGRTGFDIMPIVFGGNVLGWTADEDASFRVLDAFVDHGFDAIDTADRYSAWVPGHQGGESETMLGKWFASRPGARAKVKLFSKVGLPMGGPDEKGLGESWIARAIDKSLQRLNTDAIDLYFAHAPDPETSHAETLGAFEALKTAGKIRAIGASNYDADRLGAAQDVAQASGLTGYQVVQPEYNLHTRAVFEGGLRDFCLEAGLGVVTYYSLASGFLTGKYRSEADFEGRGRGRSAARYMDERGMRLLDVLDDLSAAHGAKPAEVALAWTIAQPGVTAPIASATSVAQVESFARAASLKLGAEDLARLTEAGVD